MEFSFSLVSLSIHQESICRYTSIVRRANSDIKYVSERREIFENSDITDVETRIFAFFTTYQRLISQVSKRQSKPGHGSWSDPKKNQVSFNEALKCLYILGNVGICSRE
jgi:hypothetical protein